MFFFPLELDLSLENVMYPSFCPSPWTRRFEPSMGNFRGFVGPAFALSYACHVIHLSTFICLFENLEIYVYVCVCVYVKFSLLSWGAPAAQTSLVFAAVFVIFWCGAALVTLNGALLGGNM